MPENNETSMKNSVRKEVPSSDDDSAFENMKSEAFKFTHKDASISVIEQQRETEFYKLLSKRSTIDQNYHYDIIKNARKIINVSVAVFVVVIAFMLVIMILSFIYSANISITLVSLIFSSIIEILDATLIALMNTLLKSKDKYFQSNNDNERLNKAMVMIQTMKDGDAKNQMIGKIIDALCNK